MQEAVVLEAAAAEEALVRVECLGAGERDYIRTEMGEKEGGRERGEGERGRGREGERERGRGREGERERGRERETIVI